MVDIEKEIISRIKVAFPDARIQLTDMTGSRDHWQAHIISSAFEGLSRLNRQRAVYSALGELMSGPIHALTFQTQTPDQAEAGES